MGGKNQTSTSQSSQSYTPAGLSGLQDIWSRIQGVANTGYTPYSGELTAPVNAQQQTGISNVNSAYGTAQPYINTAANYATAGAAPITAQQIQQYQSPYTQQVIAATQRQFADNNAQQQQQVIGNAALQGALGGDRVGVAQAELARQQKLAQDPVIASLNNQGYTQALNAAQQDRAAQGQAAYTYGNLGTTAQNAALQGAGAQINAGTLQQQTQQAADTANYGQYLQQFAFPYQQAQFLSGLGLPVLSSMGGSSSGNSTTTQPGPSPWGQIAGIGLTAASLFSDKNVKENVKKVGEDFDGQGIYKFNYKGSPVTQIGYIAQEVEKKNPEAVGSSHGIKIVNYDIASTPAAERGHYAVGGAVTDGAPFNFTDAPSYIPKVNIAQGFMPQMPSSSGGMTGGSGGGGNGGLGMIPSASDMKTYAQGFKNLGGLFDSSNLSFGTPGGTNPFPGGSSTAIYARGGAVKRYAFGGGVDMPSYFTSPSMVPDQDADPSPFASSTFAPSSQFNSGVPVNIPQTQGFGGGAQAPNLPAPVNIAASPDASNLDLSARSSPFAAATKRLESGGDYGSIGPETRTGDRAYGAYGIMGANVGPWTKQVLGREMTPQEFLNNSDAQDAVYKAKFGTLVDKHGPEGAARAWFAGEGGMNDPNRKDVLGTTVGDYGRRFMSALGDEDQAMAFNGEAKPSSPFSITPTQSQQPKSQYGGWNPLSLSDEARTGLLAAGLGMMASRSPFVGTQIGEGGLAGLQTYAGQKKETADRAMQQQRVDLQAQQLAKQLDQFQKEFGLKQQQTNETARYHDILDQQRKDALEERRTRSGYVRNADGTMTPIEGGPADPKQIAAVAKAKQTGGLLPDDTADFLANRILAGDSKALVGLGRGAQGAENITKVQSLVAKKATEQGLNAQDILAKSAEQSGLTAQQRTFGTQVARMAVNSTEAQGALELGREASRLVPRGNWTPINKLIQKGQVIASDPNLAKFGAANLAIINTYSRAINPNGVGTVHDKQHAEDLLSTAMGPDAYEAVLDQLNKEIEIAHAAPLKAKKEMEAIRKSGQTGSPEAAPPAAKTLPNRVRQNGHTFEKQPDGSYKAID